MGLRRCSHAYASDTAFPHLTRTKLQSSAMKPGAGGNGSIRTLFEHALNLTPENLSQFLANPELAPHVKADLKALLDVDGGSETFLNDIVIGNQLHERGTGERFGPYELRELLGRGGMGVVFKAERVDGELTQTVAIKLMQHAWLDPRSFERFRNERQTLAGLVHNNIARLLDGGTRADGVAFLVMEYVDGLPLDQYCRKHQLSIVDRLRQFLPLCQAVGYAHRKLIVHRDLKPSNVIVTVAGEPKLLDFGIAKTLGETPSGHTTPTLVFTPDYASPEQARGEEITTATDIYGLGAVLYFLLTDRSPHALAGQSPAEIQQAISEDDPPKPSHLRPELRGDLENIVMRALHRDPSRRYNSAYELADDITRYLEHRPVRATPDGWAYRAQRFVQRHVVAGVAAAAVTIVLAAGVSVALFEARQASREARTARAVEGFLRGLFEANSADQPNPAKGRLMTARELLDIGASKIKGELKDAPEAKLEVLETLGGMYYDLGLDDQAVTLNRERVEQAKSLYGNRGPILAKALVDLGQSMHASSFVNERETVLNQAKILLDQQQDFSSESRGRLLRAMAEQYESTDRAKAVELAHQSVEFYRRNQSTDGLIEALYLEGVIRSDRAEFKQSLPLFTEMIALARTKDGESSPVLARAYAYKGEAEQSLLKLTDGDRSLRYAYNAARKLNGDNHVDSIQTGLRLGSFLCKWAHFQEGLAYLEQARTTVLKTRGPDDPFHTPQVLFEYGFALLKAGNLERGSAAIEQAIANRRRNRPGTIYLAFMLETQSSALIDMGHYTDAQRLLDEASGIRGDVHDQSDRINISARVKLLLTTNKFKEAKNLLERSYGIAVEGKELSSLTLRVLLDRCAVAVREGDHKTAIDMATQTRNQIAATSEMAYLEEWDSWFALSEGESFLALHQPEKALPLLQRSVEVKTHILDPNSPALAEALIQLAECHRQLGNRNEAENLAKKAHKMIAAHPHLGGQYTLPLRHLEQAVS